MRHKLCGDRHNPWRADYLQRLRDLIEEAAGPVSTGDTRQSWLNRAARAIGISYSRAWNVWYGKAKTVSAAEYEAAKQAAHRARVERLARLEAEIADLRRTIQEEP